MMHVVRTLPGSRTGTDIGLPKTGQPRSISLSAMTVSLLRLHRQHQRELRMANRPRYATTGSSSPRNGRDLQRTAIRFGLPLQMNNLGQREYARSSRRPA